MSLVCAPRSLPAAGPVAQTLELIPTGSSGGEASLVVPLEGKTAGRRSRPRLSPSFPSVKRPGPTLLGGGWVSQQPSQWTNQNRAPGKRLNHCQALNKWTNQDQAAEKRANHSQARVKETYHGRAPDKRTIRGQAKDYGTNQDRKAPETGLNMNMNTNLLSDSETNLRVCPEIRLRSVLKASRQ
jgi:hypothetical protein